MSRKTSDRIARILADVGEADALRFIRKERKAETPEKAARIRNEAEKKRRRDRRAVGLDRNMGDVLVTVRYRKSGELRTVQGVSIHGRNAAVVQALTPFDPREWQVRSISSASSILTDLGREGNRTGLRVQPPETVILGQIKMKAYL